MKKPAMVVCFCLLLVACSTSQVITALDGVQIATTIASAGVPVLCGAGVIPAPLCPPIEAYIGAAGIAAANSANELKTSDANSVKISVIYDIFAQVIIPILPPGTDPRVAGYIAGVDGAVKAFFSVLGPKQGTAATRGLMPLVINPNFLERRKLSQIHDKAMAAAEAVRR